VDEFEGGESLDVIRRKFEEGIREDDPGRMLVWAGTGVGLMKEIKSAKTIVQELHEECSNRLRAIATSCI